MGWPDELPLLLAGPIVRRVEPDLASVWVALRERRTVRLSLWEGVVDAGTGPGTFDGPAPLVTDTRDTRRVGDRLHTVVVTVRSAPLRPDTTYSYNVSLEGGGEPADLRSLGLLGGETPLGYGVGELPTFVLPPSGLQDLQLVHASCRLANDQNDPGPDAMAWLDDRIAATRHDPRARPHQVYLTGDQIYADHVAVALLAMLTRLGNTLVGGTERVEVLGRARPVDQAHFPAGWRQHAAQDVAHLTSTSPASHLFSLAEYCAMYLAAWSPAMWPPSAEMPDEELAWLPDRSLSDDLRALHLGVDRSDLPAFGSADPCGFAGHSPCDEQVVLSTLPDVVRDACQRVRDLCQTVRRERALIARFRTGVAAVRRALANVAVYVILDDHEVTDDWNVTHRWRERVHSTPLGRAVVRNALVAYALFQGEGNDPARFAQPGSPELQLMERITQLFPAGVSEPPDDGAVGEVDRLLGLGADPPQLTWDYVVAGSRHQTIVLDTRTHRTWAGEVAPAALVAPDEIGRQIPEGPRPAGIDVVLVVSAAPVLGIPVFERLVSGIWIGIGDFLYSIGKHGQRGHLDPDRESWANDPPAFESLLRRLAPYRRVVFLSGDVHYAMSAELTYWDGDGEPSRFVQLTSSGACNSWPALVQYAARGVAPIQQLLELMTPVEQLAWTRARPLPLAIPEEAFVTPAVRFRLDREPVLVHNRGWPAGTELARDPDWSWRLRLLVDERPVEQLPEAARPLPVAPGFDPADGADAYQTVATRHAAGLSSVTNGRHISWLHNIGVVTFPEVEGKLAVQHVVLSRHPHGHPPEAPDSYLVHRARVDGTDEDPPRLVTDQDEDAAAPGAGQ